MQASSPGRLTAAPRGAVHTDGPRISVVGFIVRAVILLALTALVVMQVLRSVMTAQAEAVTLEQAAALVQVLGVWMM
jgi:hypothetical protein